MNFSELEKIMSMRGVNTLAEIARTLATTPQAVSNWKARDQVPYHIVAKINEVKSSTEAQAKRTESSNALFVPPNLFDENVFSLSDIGLTIAVQLKVILIIPIMAIFLSFTYVKFIQQPEYISEATLLLPDNKAGNLGGLAGLASQFGVNIPSGGVKTDLSSPSLFPELLRSRTFGEKVLAKNFYTQEFGKELTLLAILTHGNDPPKYGKDTLITKALGSLGSILQFKSNTTNPFSVLRVTATEPVFAKELAEVVLIELEALNRFFKSQTVNEKTTFIENRIASVDEDLELSEKKLKEFNEQNRQISSPSLELQLDRLTRNVEIQKGIFLTLKQQLELAKIEEVQETSIVQILDRPQVPLRPSNINLKLSVISSAALGLVVGLLFGFVRSFLESNDMQERKKYRRIKHFIKKKSKDIILDYRVSGLISVMMFIALPFYLGSESKYPVFFGRYSLNLMILNTIYILTLGSSISLCLYLKKKNNK